MIYKILRFVFVLLPVKIFVLALSVTSLFFLAISLFAQYKSLKEYNIAMVICAEHIFGSSTINQLCDFYEVDRAYKTTISKHVDTVLVISSITTSVTLFTSIVILLIKFVIK